MSSNLKVNTILPSTGDTVAISGIVSATNGATFSGIITGTSFSGTVPSSSLSGALPALDGSALTGVVGSGSGVVVQNSGSAVGTAGTINFGDNLSVSPVSAGIVTITASAGGGSTAEVRANTLEVLGVSTFHGHVNTGTGATVGIGSTAYFHKVAFDGQSGAQLNIHPSPTSGDTLLFDRSDGTSMGAWSTTGLFISGNGVSNNNDGPDINTQLHVRNSGNCAVKLQGGGTSSVGLQFINSGSSGSAGHNILSTHDLSLLLQSSGGNNITAVKFNRYIGPGYGASYSTLEVNVPIHFKFGSITKASIDNQTGIGTFLGINVNGATSTLSNVNVTGVITATTFKGAVQATSGTFSSGVDITGDLDVDGHTDLDNVSVAGVVTATTFVGALTGNAATATALQNARTIGGVSFDGTANINLPAKGGFLFPEELMQTYPSVGESLFSLFVNTDITSTIKEQSTLPDHIVLHDAYPNPFNPNTMIRFDLKQIDHVRLNIFDLKGRQVASLVDEIMHSGNHQVPWNPVALPSGVYLVDLKTGKKSFKQKITYIK